MNPLTRVYLDTSVFGGQFDTEFRAHTEAFFKQVFEGLFDIVVSEATVAEILPAPPAVLDFFASVPKGPILEIDSRAKELQQAYLDALALGPASRTDALHVALATIARVDYIVSWNFKHLVNVNKIRLFNSVNLARSYGVIDIRSPLEALYRGTEDI